MDQATDFEPARIDDLLTAYRDLQAQFDRVLERVRRAEEQKQTVPRRIYDRVRGEYDRELDSIRARMTPVRDEIARVHESIEAQARDARSVVEAIEEELSEAEFRHRIGEFAGTEYAALRNALDARVEDARTRQNLLKTTLTAIAAMRRPEPPPTPVAPSAPVAEQVATLEPVPSPAAATDTDDRTQGEIDLEEFVSGGATAEPVRNEGFENPHDWISETVSEAPLSDRRVHLNTPPAPQAPVAPPAADPDEFDQALAPLEAHTGMPSLVFVSGPHAGQAIALLPTTLTIGREHDNNVEIKDADVARYHARILRDRGDYVVEDLDSSTGTWVNGERKKRALLTHGDVIRVGQTELALDFEWTTDTR